MTLLAVFVRRVRGYEELVVASDSRLSGGKAMDFAQKVFQLPRSDALFAFAGDTDYAYPLMMQMLRAVECYPFSADRRLPLPKLKGHTLRVFQQTYASIHSLPHGQRHPETPDNYFLLAGYDWQTHKFQGWRLSFDESKREFVYRPIIGPTGTSFFFASDDRPAVTKAIERTNRLLAERGKTVNEIDMEPFEVLSKIILEEDHFSIGGAPQIGKVYAHLNTQLFQVLWPASGKGPIPHVAGRPLMPDEKNVLPIFDPVRGFYSPKDLARGSDITITSGEEETGAG